MAAVGARKRSRIGAKTDILKPREIDRLRRFHVERYPLGALLEAIPGNSDTFTAGPVRTKEQAWGAITRCLDQGGTNVTVLRTLGITWDVPTAWPKEEPRLLLWASYGELQIVDGQILIGLERFAWRVTEDCRTKMHATAPFFGTNAEAVACVRAGDVAGSMAFLRSQWPALATLITKYEQGGQ